MALRCVMLSLCMSCFSFSCVKCFCVWVLLLILDTATRYWQLVQVWRWRSRASHTVGRGCPYVCVPKAVFLRQASIRKLPLGGRGSLYDVTPLLCSFLSQPRTVLCVMRAHALPPPACCVSSKSLYGFEWHGRAFLRYLSWCIGVSWCGTISVRHI